MFSIFILCIFILIELGFSGQGVLSVSVTAVCCEHCKREKESERASEKGKNGGMKNVWLLLP